MGINSIGSLVWKVIGKVVPPRKVVEPCVMCGKHDANPTQYFEDEMFTYCDYYQENFNLSQFEAEIERLEEYAERESLDTSHDVR